MDISVGAESTMQTQVRCIEGSIVLTERDVTQSRVERASRSPYMTLGLFGGVFVLQAAARTSLEAAFVSLIVMTIGGLIALYQIPRSAARRIYRRLTSQGENRWSYRFDDDGVTIRGPGMVVGFSYRHLSRVRETERALEVRSVLSSDLWTIPKAAFSPDDVSRIRLLLRAPSASR